MLKQTVGSLAKLLVPRGLYYRCCRLYDRSRSVGRFFTYQGLRYKCPFCGLRFRRFVAEEGEPSPLFENERIIGGGPFENAECPFCFSFERERHVYLFLREMTDVFDRPTRLLHVAPEKRLQRILMKQGNIDYVSADLDLSRAQIKMDLTEIQFPADTFDVVICNHVLEHIPADQRAMQEILRVLKPGGWAMLQVPIASSRPDTREDASIVDSEERLRLYGQRDHVRIYGTDFRKRLESVGFVVELRNIREKLGDKSAQQFALIQDEQLYVAKKVGK